MRNPKFKSGDIKKAADRCINMSHGKKCQGSCAWCQGPRGKELEIIHCNEEIAENVAGYPFKNQTQITYKCKERIFGESELNNDGWKFLCYKDIFYDVRECDFEECFIPPSLELIEEEN